MSSDEEKRNGEVSLHPLEFEDALRGLLQTKPTEEKRAAEREKNSVEGERE